MKNKQKKQIKKGVDNLWIKYAHTLELLDKALEELDKKPKEIEVIKVETVEKVVEKEVPVEVIKEVEVEKIVEKEVPVEVIKEIEIIKEVPVEKVVEKIVKVEVPVEVEKETVVTVEKEVPGPERIVEVEVPGPERIVKKIVEVIKEVPGPEKIVEKVIEKPITIPDYVKDQEITKLTKNNQALLKRNRDLEKELNNIEPEVIETPSTRDLSEAARLMAKSELNKEDLSHEQILKILTECSDAELKNKLGFWAVPLPKPTDESNLNKVYIRKK